MDKAAFTDLLREMSAVDRDFAAQYVTNDLPGSFRYFAYLNESVDTDPLRPGEKVFAANAALAGTKIGPLDEQAAVSLLWRDGMVPEWIDISVMDADAMHTYFQLRCCGRFTADEALMYYARHGQGPFGVKSPAFPPLWTDGMGRFDLREGKEPRADIFRRGGYVESGKSSGVPSAPSRLGIFLDKFRSLVKRQERKNATVS